MYSDAEIKLLESGSGGFPLLAAAQAAYKQCHSCSHANVNVHAMLRTALYRYRSDKQFLEHCKKLFRLPCGVAGVFLEDS